MKGNIFRLLIAVSMLTSFTLLVSGCGKGTVDSEAMKPSTEQEGLTGTGTKADIGEGPGDVEPIDATYSPETEKFTISEGRTNGPMLPIYYDFDKSNIRDDQKARLEGNADFLKANPRLDIRIEGNCDERGTNEYNMALGERRAQSAKKYLVNLGVPMHRINTMSYGEEKPLLYGHDEYSWAQNRRADFVIQ
jgi:peptidoglycan-associated lipoprotein